MLPLPTIVNASIWLLPVLPTIYQKYRPATIKFSLVGTLVGFDAFKNVECCKIRAFTTTTDNLIVVSSSIKAYT